VNIADLVIVIILIIGAINGYRRGLLRGLAEGVSSLLGFIIAFNSYKLAVAWFDEAFQVISRLKAFLEAHFVLPRFILEAKLDVPLDDLGVLLEKILLPTTFKTQLLEYIQSLEQDLAGHNVLGDVIYDFLTSALLNAAAFLLIWLISYLIILAVFNILIKVTDDTIFAALDHGGGLIIGLLLTFLTLTVIIGLISPFLQVADMADNTIIARIFTALNESRYVPYFLNTFNYLTGKIASLWL